MDETTKTISSLLHEAGETHHTVYRTSDHISPIPSLSRLFSDPLPR